jgi:hypothetical protein
VALWVASIVLANQIVLIAVEKCNVIIQNVTIGPNLTKDMFAEMKNVGKISALDAYKKAS